MPRLDEVSDEAVLNFDELKENPGLVGAIVTMIGQEVNVETKDGSKFRGIFSACGPQVKQIGLSYAYKLPGKGYENYVLCKPDATSPPDDHLPYATEKMVFDFSDVVEITHVVQDLGNKHFCRVINIKMNACDASYICMKEDCKISSVNMTQILVIDEVSKRGFLTDKEYTCNGDKTEDQDELKEWEGDDEYNFPDEHNHDEGRHDGSGGWSVEAMFSMNSSLGVTTSFKDDLTQYTTVDPEGTEEDRIRAEKIALEIENNVMSQRRALLENDDEERDLDKETSFDNNKDGGFESVSSRRGNNAGRRNNNNTYSSKNLSKRNDDGFNQTNEFRISSSQGRGNRGTQNRTRPFSDRTSNNFNPTNDNQPRQNFTTSKSPRHLNNAGVGGLKSSDSQRNWRDNNNQNQSSYVSKQGSKINELKNWHQNFNMQSQESGTSQPLTPTSTMADLSISPSSSSIPDNAQGSLQAQPIQNFQRQPNAWQNGPPDFRSNFSANSMQYTDQQKNTQYRNERSNQQSGKTSQSPTFKKNDPIRRGSEQTSYRRTSRQSSPKTSPTHQHFSSQFKDPIEPRNDPSASSQIPKVESLPSFPSNAASTSGGLPTDATSASTTNVAAITTDTTSMEKPVEKVSLSTAASTSNLSDATTTSKKFEFNPDAPAFVPKKQDSGQLANSPAPLPIHTPLIHQQLPLPMTPVSMQSVIQPSSVMGQPPVIVNYQAAPNVYGMPHPSYMYPPAGAISNIQSLAATQQHTSVVQTSAPSQTHPIQSQTPSGTSSSSTEAVTTNTAVPAANGSNAQTVYTGNPQSFQPGNQAQSRFNQQQPYQQANIQIPNQNTYIPNQQIQYQQQIGQYSVMPPTPIMVSYPGAYGVQSYTYPPNLQNSQVIAASRQQSATPPVHSGHQNYPLPSQTPSGTSSFGSEAVQPNMIVSGNGQQMYAVNIPAQGQQYNPNMGAHRFPQPFQHQGQVPNSGIYITPPFQPQFVQGQYPGPGQLIMPVLPNQYLMYANPGVQQINPTQISVNTQALPTIQGNFGNHQTSHGQNLNNNQPNQSNNSNIQNQSSN